VSSIIGTFRIGEDIEIALDVEEGDIGAVTATTANIRRVLRVVGEDLIFDGAGLAMTVSDRAASGATPAGWTLVYPAASSASLTPGIYAADVRHTLGAAVEKTERSGLIRLTEAAV